MVLVTSAKGRVGRLIIDELLKKNFEIRALDINPAAIFTCPFSLTRIRFLKI